MYHRLRLPGLLAGCFLLGWMAGNVNWSVIFNTWYLSYENKYLSMSGSLVEEVVYHVVVNDVASLDSYVQASDSNVTLHETPFDKLFDVRVAADQRSRIVNEIRALDGIGAVLSVPLMCH